MPVLDFERLRSEATTHPYPLLFATVSGAHLYGFPSPDSDFDLRGVHILPVGECVGLLPKRETVELTSVRNGMELDLVTHDISKFCHLLLKRNGYVLEQLYSPLIVQSNAVHEELKDIARGAVTRHHCHHYLGFAATQWRLFEKEDPPRVKPLLYLYRVLLTGIHLMRTGQVEANLIALNEEFRLPWIAELVERKIHGAEKSRIENVEMEFHRGQYETLAMKLEEAAQRSRLPELPDCREALNDLLVRVRLANGENGQGIPLSN